ncbi:MAG: TonB family protein [Acidobacteria bacterium]|nr:TonB family protein [Acidobacteriota bacterium]
MKRFAVSLFAVFAFSVVALAQNTSEKPISGGILNGKLKKMPKPEYPVELAGSGIKGLVRIAILIDEEGKVISAEPELSPIQTFVRDKEGKVVETDPITEPAHPLLVEAARQAALNAEFSPTMLSGVPVKVNGVLLFSFSDPETRTASNYPATTTSGKNISGGVLNGKAISLPKPAYPAAARAVRAGGAVTVQVVLDEEGNVASASAVSGHPLLRAAATEAAQGAKFSPTTLQGEPVKVSGVIVYNFVAPDPEK